MQAAMESFETTSHYLLCFLMAMASNLVADMVHNMRFEVRMHPRGS